MFQPTLKLAAFSLALSLGAAQAATSTLSKRDQSFVDKAAIAGLFEVEASHLALSRSTRPQITAFAKMMVSDHGKANAQLKTLASMKGTPVPGMLDKTHAEALAKLSAKKPGAEFDEAYADAMEDGHDKAVVLFETAAKDLDDADLKAYAAETLPTLKTHSEQAEKLDNQHIAP